MKKNEPLFIGEYDKSVILTYMGAAFALLAVYAIIQSQLRLAMMAFIVSGICDLFDGVVARRMKRTESQKRFGIEIDSLCDMISFAALPAVLLMTQLPLGAVTRLAHFNRLAKHDEGSEAYFIGLPVTYSALFFPLTYLVCQWLAPGFFAWVLLGLSLLLTFLFVYNCRIPKPNKLAYLVFAILAVASLIGLGVLPHG